MSEDTIRIIERQPARFPVLKSTGEVYRGVFTNFFGLLRAAWLPLLVYILLRSLDALITYQAFMYRISDGHLKGSKTSGSSVGALASNLAQSRIFDLSTALPFWLALGFTAIAFHRFVLIGERKHGWKNAGLEFGARELQFAISCVKVSLLTWLPFVVSGWIVWSVWGRNIQVLMIFLLIQSIIYLLIAGVSMRVSFMLPHTALGHRSNLGLVWRQSEGQTWRLALFSFLVFLPFAFYYFLKPSFITVVFRPHAASLGLSWYLLGYLTDLLVGVLSLMLTITSLSVAYREIIGPPATAIEDGQGAATPSTHPFALRPPIS